MKPPVQAVSSVKRAVITALCIALCYALPLAFHAVGLGAAFSPLHLPVLLCGLLCGWPYGLFCGLAGPLVSSLLGGMPSAMQLPYHLPEIAVYGFLSGLLYRFVRTGSRTADLYLSLIPAMLLGRVVGGAAAALVFLPRGQAYSLALWASAYFVKSLPGIVLQLILLPLLVLALTLAGLIPRRYPNSTTSSRRPL